MWWASALAVIAAIIDFGDWFTSENPEGLITQEQLTIGVSAMAASSGVLMAFAARSFDKALLLWRPMATAAGATFGIAAIYHFLDGWIPKVGLAVLITVAIIAAANTLDEVPPKSRYLTDLTVDHRGLTVTTANGATRHLPWEEIRSLKVPHGVLVAKLVSKPAPPSRYSPFSYDAVEDHLVLFIRHHFGSPHTVGGALRLHGGERADDLISWT